MNIVNNSLETVLVKVMLINDFYGTNVYDTLSVAQHILSISEIDARLTSGDLKLIIDIGNMQSKTSNQYFYSFATKYCSFHNPEGFPIFDKYIEYVLSSLDKEKFFKRIEAEGIETDYEKAKGLRNPGILYKKVKYVGNEIDFLKGRNLKIIDQYLWAFGKDQYLKAKEKG